MISDQQSLKPFFKPQAENTLIDNTEIDNLTTNIQYNEFGEPILETASFQGSEIYKAEYTRDNLGRLKAKTETINGLSKNFTYNYDSEHRLQMVSENGSVRTYDYDLNGNRTKVNGLDIASYDEQDRLVSYGGNTYSFNAAGDLVSKANTSGTTLYNYDVFGNLVSASTPGGRNIEYVIDGRNRRIGKKVNGILEQGFVYKDQLNPVAELDSSGSVVSRFIYGTRAHVPDYMIKGGVKYRFITDNVGSVKLVVDTESGQIAQRIDYDEWGNVISDSNPGFQPFGFAGGIYDRDTKLVRFGARDYDPETGRWTAKDPILFNGGQANLYVYVGNDPINFLDPRGLDLIGAVAGGIGGAVGGAVAGAISSGSLGGAVASAAVGAAAGAITGYNPSIGAATGAIGGSRALGAAAGAVGAATSNLLSSNGVSSGTASAIGGAVAGIVGGKKATVAGAAGGALGGTLAGALDKILRDLFGICP